MSLLRSRQVAQLRGILNHARQFPRPGQFSTGGRINNVSVQRSPGYRDLRVHRQSDKAWRPPPARNEHLSSMQMMQEAAQRPQYSPSYTSRQSIGRIQTGTHGQAPVNGGEAAPGSGSGAPLGGGMFLSYHDLERALERRGLSAVRFLLSVGAALAVGIGLMWPRIKRWGAAEGAEVAAASLQQEELKMHAAALVNALIAEPKTTREVETMLKQAIIGLMKDEDIKREMAAWTAGVFSEAMMWPGVVAKGTEYVETVLKDEKSIDYAYDYFSTAAKMTASDDKVLDAASAALWASVRGLFGRRRETPPVVEKQVDVPPAQSVAASSEEKTM